MSRTRRVSHPRSSGLTLLELLVVLALIALITAAVTLSIRPSRDREARQEATRLVALLEAGRMHSQRLGRSIEWRPTASGFEFTGLSATELPNHWQTSTAPKVSGQWPLVLGPEPIIAAQSIELDFTPPDSSESSKVEVFTDGLAPFQLR